MQSILTAETNYLYDMIDEISKRFMDMHISECEKEYLRTIQLQITTEFELRNAHMGYKHCYYRHENGECAAIGRQCESNGYGDTLKRCQQYRETYIRTTRKK